MRKLSEIKGEDALDVLAEIIEPMAEISADDEFRKLVNANQKIQAVKKVMHDHKESVLHILAVLEGVEPEEYSPSVVELPIVLMNMLKDPDLLKVFFLADPKKSSGSATENTAEIEKE